MARPGVVFDFDGTIALSEHVHMTAWHDLSKEYGKPLAPGFLEKSVGATDLGLARDLEEDWGGTVGYAVLLEKKRRYYQNRAARESTLVPGIEAFLKKLKGIWPIGLATSASIDDITPTLEANRLTKYFDVILTVESVSNPKPHPEIYLSAAERLGITPAASFAFEDSPIGASAAFAAGMKVIGLTTTYAVAGIGPVLAGIPDYLDSAKIERLLGFNGSTRT